MTAAVTILGSTGSIGTSTLDVIRRHPDRLSVYALTANRSVSAMKAQCLEFQPAVAVMRDEDAAIALNLELRAAGSSTKVLAGPQALEDVAAGDGDIVMAAIVGGAGLGASLAAAKAGKRLLLANKEALVMAGKVFMETVAAHRAELLPIDSEHNAIFQCLANGTADRAGGVRRLFLTASGGPLMRPWPAAIHHAR